MITTNPLTFRMSTKKELGIAPETIIHSTGRGRSFTGNCFIYENQFDPETEEYKEPVFLGMLIQNPIGLHGYNGKTLSDDEIAELTSFADNYQEPDYDDYEVVDVISLRK